jgi:hypothetical protein
LVGQSEGGCRRQRAPRPGVRHPRHARRLSRDHHPDRRGARRHVHRVPVHRGAQARAKGLDHGPGVHLGQVHDPGGAERHRRHIQARLRAPGHRRGDDGGGPVRAFRAGGSS